MLLQETSLDLYRNRLNPDLIDSLRDIATNVEIDNFCIRHPNYKPLELPPEAVERLQNMPLALQQKYFRSQLQNFLYGIYYNASLKAVLAPESETEIKPQDLENNTFLGIDLNFYEQIHNSNTGEGYFDRGWLVVREEGDGPISVTKSGLTVHVQRDRHLKSAEESIAVGDSIAIRLPKNLIQNGFYVAVSNAGVRSQQSSHSQLVRIYWNVTPEGAISVMRSLTQKLNEVELPFTFKVLYNPSDYQRCDSGVLYFDSHEYHRVYPILQSVYEKHQHYFQPEIPLFTKLLAPGLGLAEEPNQKFAAVESFGMNRCQIVASGLLAAQKQGNNSIDGRLSSILGQFSLLGIDIHTPYLNYESRDIYLPLN